MEVLHIQMMSMTQEVVGILRAPSFRVRGVASINPTQEAVDAEGMMGLEAGVEVEAEVEVGEGSIVGHQTISLAQLKPLGNQILVQRVNSQHYQPTMTSKVGMRETRQNGRELLAPRPNIQVNMSIRSQTWTSIHRWLLRHLVKRMGHGLTR